MSQVTKRRILVSKKLDTVGRSRRGPFFWDYDGTLLAQKGKDFLVDDRKTYSGRMSIAAPLKDR